MNTQSLKPGWKMVKFGDIARNVNNFFDRAIPGVHPYVAGPNIIEGRLRIPSASFAETEDIPPTFKRLFEPNDVLFHSRNMEKLAVPDFSGITGEKLFVLRTKDDSKLVQEYLPFVILSEHFKEYTKGRFAGSTNKFLNWSALRDYQLPLPPLDEQKRIAEILWAADEAVETKFRVVSEFTVSWQKLIDSIVPDPDESPSRTVVRLVDLCSMQNGRPFPSTAYSEHGFKLLRPGNLAPDGSLSWAEGSTVRLDEKYVQENSGWVVRPGDVVINLTAQSLEDGFMGRACLAVEGDDSLLNQRLGRFLCNEGVEGEYLYRVLQTSRFRRMVEARCEGSKVRHTYFRHFADLPVVKASAEEQREIIRAASSIDVARKAAKDSVRDSRALLGRLINGFIGNGQSAYV